MQTTTSLTFFTAIFVALGGALAKELMICCRHVRTELYSIQMVNSMMYLFITMERRSSMNGVHLGHSIGPVTHCYMVISYQEIF